MRVRNGAMPYSTHTTQTPALPASTARPQIYYRFSVFSVVYTRHAAVSPPLDTLGSWAHATATSCRTRWPPARSHDCRPPGRLVPAQIAATPRGDPAAARPGDPPKDNNFLQGPHASKKIFLTTPQPPIHPRKNFSPLQKLTTFYPHFTRS
jgi:hypothetical protein